MLIEMALTDIDGKRALLRLPALNFSLAYEEEPLLKLGGVPLGKVIVSKKSATALRSITGGDPMDVKGFDRNHLTLVKPYDQCDCVYRWVADALLKGLTHDAAACRATCP